MPYLTPETKADLAERAYAVGAGELNFVLTNVLIEYYNTNGHSYQTHNDIIGALECASREWYRRVTVPYEDAKKRANGDVYFDPGEDPADPVPVVVEVPVEKKKRRRG